MLKTLYTCFQHWSNNGSVFVYSDTHFCDDDCYLMDKNWVTPQEQIDLINSKVHKNDTLILLGDVGDVEWIKKIKSRYKILILGNHDSGANNYKRKYYDITLPFNEISFIDYVPIYRKNNDTFEHFDFHSQYNKEIINPKLKYFSETIHDFSSANYKYNEDKDSWEWVIHCDNKLFDEVYTGPLMISEKIILSHEPISNINWALNIHGHNHSRQVGDGYHYNVCSNMINYTPVNLKEIINSGSLNKIESLHRLTIDNATDRKRNRRK